MVVVVLPTPPFWLAIAMIRAGPCRSVGIGSGIGRRMVYADGSDGPSSAPRSSPACSARSVEVQASAWSVLPTMCFLAALPLCSPRSRGFVPVAARLYATRRRSGPACHRPGGVSGGRPPYRKAVGRPAHAGPGVRGRVDLTQPLHRDQRVYLGGGDAGVPQQLLHHPHVGAAVEQVGGVRVPQRVGRDRLGAPPQPGARRGRPGCPTHPAGSAAPPRALRNSCGGAPARAAASAGRPAPARPAPPPARTGRPAPAGCARPCRAG